MGRWVVFGVIITKVFFAWFPIDKEVALTDAVTDPIEPHVHGPRAALADGGIYDVKSGGVVGLNWSGQLRMPHFLESRTEDFGGLAVYEEGTNFGFGGRGHDISENAALAVDAAVVGGLADWGFGGIAWIGA